MTYQHILVAVDESPISYAAVEASLALAKSLGSQVTLTTVLAVDPFVGVDFYKLAPSITEYVMQAQKNAEAQLAEIQLAFVRDGIPVNSKIIHGQEPAEGILLAADEVGADLIMMGSHGRKGLKKIILGSVAQSVLNISPLPVMIIKQ